MDGLFNDESGHALLSLLNSLGEEINKACDTEKLLSGKGKRSLVQVAVIHCSYRRL